MTEGKRVELLHDRLAWLAKMTRDHDKPIEPKVLKPHQLGWLRRPELDHGDIEVGTARPQAVGMAKRPKA
jgi:hypothetical protein